MPAPQLWLLQLLSPPLVPLPPQVPLRVLRLLALSPAAHVCQILDRDPAWRSISLLRA